MRVTTSEKRVVSVLFAMVALAMASATPAFAASLYSYGGASGSVTITSVDNSGWSRSLTMRQTICKDSTTLGRMIEYKMNFGSSVRTDWKGGVSRGLSSGCSSGYKTDTFYYPNSARGVWARVCIDVPGPVNQCGSSVYIPI
jgi:hypothetical protein